MIILDEYEWKTTLSNKKKSLRQVKKALSRLSETRVKAWWCLEKWRKFEDKARCYEKFLVSRGYYLSYDSRNYYARRYRHRKLGANAGLNAFIKRGK